MRVAGAIAVVVIALLAVWVLLSSAYAIDEAEQVVIVQFGKPIGEPITEPGLHFKLPFIQEIRRFDKRLLAWDGDPNQIPTRGREFISIDTTARWRISAPPPVSSSKGADRRGAAVPRSGDRREGCPAPDPRPSA